MCASVYVNVDVLEMLNFRMIAVTTFKSTTSPDVSMILMPLLRSCFFLTVPLKLVAYCNVVTPLLLSHCNVVTPELYFQ